MGLSPFGRCSIYPSTCGQTGAPKPANFNILNTKEVGDNLVAVIQYPDCTNFEGNKICVFLNTSAQELYSRAEVDPHFSRSSKSPFARFVPTTEGAAAALKLAEMGVTK